MSFAQMILTGLPVITTNAAPTMGSINSYNASTAPLTVPLQGLNSLGMGAFTVVEKSLADTTFNAVTFNCNGVDTFDDGSTSITLTSPGEKRAIQLINPAGNRFWKVNNATYPKTGLVAIASEFSLTNSIAASTIITFTLPPANLAAGSTFRIKAFGTIQVQATSGTLTFTPFIQNTALNTIQLASQTSAEGPVGFWLETYVTVRTTGSSGSAIAHGGGMIRFATNTQINQILTTTNTATTTINTTSGAASTALLLQAQWATASATNILKVETATIERVV